MAVPTRGVLPVSFARRSRRALRNWPLAALIGAAAWAEVFIGNTNPVATNKHNINTLNTRCIPIAFPHHSSKTIKSQRNSRERRSEFVKNQTDVSYPKSKLVGTGHNTT
jgi:hypothetical protein